MNKTEKVELIIIIALIIIVGSTLIYSKLVKQNLKKYIVDENVIQLENVNRFFSIDSSISKYIKYVAAKDIDSIMKILDKSFIEKNNITNDNVLSMIDNYETNYRSSTREVYQVRSYNNIYVYYAKVELYEETLYTTSFINSAHFKVTVDENKLAFFLEPIKENEYLKKTRKEHHE